jgi:hypothetical protein
LLAKEAKPLADRNAVLQKKAADLIDHSGPAADQARSHAVKGLQIQLIAGLYRNAACRWPLHSFRDRVRIPEVILVTLTERFGISRWHLLYVMTECNQLTTHIIGQSNAACSCLYQCQLSGRLQHPSSGTWRCAPRASKPRPTLRAVRGGSTAGPSHSRKSSSKICCDAQHCWLADNWEALGSTILLLSSNGSVRALSDMCENGHIVLRSRSALYELHSNAVETPNAVR